MARPSLTVLVLLRFLCTGCTEEAEDRAFPGPLMAALDTDGDRRIARDEFQSIVAQGTEFLDYDVNADG